MKLVKSLTWLVAIMFLFGAVGCGDDDDDNGQDNTLFLEIAAEGSAYFGAGTKNITGDALYSEILNGGTTHFIIDYRSAAHFELGHIDGAVNWAVGDMIDNLDQIPAGAKVINVCYSGQTASQVTSVMRVLGYDAWNLKFGMCGWTAEMPATVPEAWITLTPTAGLADQLSTNAVSLPAQGEYPELSSNASDAMAAFAGFADAYFEGGTKNVSSSDVINGTGDFANAFVVNYWPQANYDMGHINGAYHFNTGDASFKSLDEDALKYLPNDGTPIVVYCFTGQTSSQITSYLNALGYNAYSMLYGMNSVTDDHTHLSDVYYHAPSQNYPLVTGP